MTSCRSTDRQTVVCPRLFIVLQVFGQRLGQAHQRDVHVVFLEAVLEVAREHAGPLPRTVGDPERAHVARGAPRDPGAKAGPAPGEPPQPARNLAGDAAVLIDFAIDLDSETVFIDVPTEIDLADSFKVTGALAIRSPGGNGIESVTDAHRKYGSELKEVAAEMLMRARAA